MAKFDEVKNIGMTILKKSKEIGSEAIAKTGKVLNETKINAEIFALNNEIKKSKVKIGDMIYQADVQTGNSEIDKLKKLIKNSLEELKYLESKKHFEIK